MKRLLTALPFVIISMLLTSLNIWAGIPQVIRPASLAALLLMSAVMALKKRVSGLSAIDKGLLIYTGLQTGIFLLSARSLSPAASDLPTCLLYTVLFCVTAFPALFQKRYFTEYFANKITPEAFRDTDIYRTINRNMSLAWSLLFAVSAFITVIPDLASLPPGMFTAMLFQVVLPMLIMLGVGLPLNAKYPAYYQKKLGIIPVTPEERVGQISDNRKNSAVQDKKEEKMEAKYKVVAVNGSPHNAIGNTSIMLRMIADGLSREGVEMEEIFLSNHRIEYCVGCGFCLENKKCWRHDDHAGITDKLLAADGIILASPVYFMSVTAQMKTFIDRSLSFGHKPRSTWKPGLAVTVSGGLHDTDTARYLEQVLRPFGAFSVGNFTAIATGPGGFLGKETVEASAADLAGVFAKAVKEKRRVPVTGDDLRFYLFMRDLVTREKGFMVDDYKHWQESGLLDSFEAYAKQEFSPFLYDKETRKQWLKDLIKEENKKGGDNTMSETDKKPAGPQAAGSCLELLKMMPMGFKAGAAGDLSAVYQFEITGPEEFVAHLVISNGKCVFHEGPHENPSVVVKSPADIWLAISKGQLDGQMAFMSGKFRVDGNISLLMSLKTLFGG
ncbi:MAG: NAD(P)H-dependent oxidoreductase [Dissulfurispiraceae bacterium]